MNLYFGLFVAACAVLLGIAVLRPRMIYEYPYFMAAAFAVFVIPQAYALVHNEWGGAYVQSALLMCFLCVLCCWLGYQWKPKAAFLQIVNVPLSLERFF